MEPLLDPNRALSILILLTLNETHDAVASTLSCSKTSIGQVKRWFYELPSQRAAAFVDDQSIKRVVEREFRDYGLPESVLDKAMTTIRQDILRHFRLESVLDDHLASMGLAATDNIELGHKAQLDVSLEGLWPVTTGAKIWSSADFSLMGQSGRTTVPATVTAYRFRVSNDGGGAVKNVEGTLEFDGVERRVCWYEGHPSNITINAYYHSYLDVYGVILNSEYGPTATIIMPTEHGWHDLQPRTLTAKLEVSLRVTAANAPPGRTSFAIDPTQGCRPIGM